MRIGCEAPLVPRLDAVDRGPGRRGCPSPRRRWLQL